MKRVVLVGALLAGACIVYHLIGLNTLRMLPEGELMASHTSPNGECAVNTYLCNGGATVDFAVRGEVVYHDGRKKNIYWQYHEQEANVFWWGERICVH